MKKICLFGATGSIGHSTLELAAAHPDQFQIVGASAHSRFETLESLNIPHLLDTRQDLNIGAFIHQCEPDIIVNAVTGFEGLKFSIATLEAGLPLALANKESLVCAGPLLKKLSTQYKAPIIPVDSEHSAIFQCLIDEVDLGALKGRPQINFKKFETIYLTASGGPFREYENLSEVTLDQALTHPNWDMGPQITIDSATLANKCLEFFEAMVLFDARPEQIQILIHPQSVIHSMVEFPDSSVMAQMSPPDMSLPIAYALNFPQRKPNHLPRQNFTGLSLEFQSPRPEIFRTLQVLKTCAEHMENFPIVFNAANEVARNAFLDGQIQFTQIFDVLETVIADTHLEEVKTLKDIYRIDNDARKKAQSCLHQ